MVCVIKLRMEVGRIVQVSTRCCSILVVAVVLKHFEPKSFRVAMIGACHRHICLSQVCLSTDEIWPYNQKSPLILY